MNENERGSRLKINYDPEEDILYIVVKDGSIFDSEQIDEDIRLEYDKVGDVAGLEIRTSAR